MLTACGDMFKSPPHTEVHTAAVAFAKKQPPATAKKLERFISNVELMRYSVKKERVSPDNDEMELAAACTGQPGYSLHKTSVGSWDGMVVCSQGYPDMERAAKTLKMAQDIQALKLTAGYRITTASQNELSRAHSCKGDVGFAIGKDKNSFIDSLFCVLKFEGLDNVQVYLKQAQMNQSSGLLNEELSVANVCEGILVHGMVKDPQGGVNDMFICVNDYN